LKYFGTVVSGAISGDGYISATRKEVGLTSGDHAVALLWAAALAAHGIKAEVRRAGGAFDVVAYGDGAVRLAGLYFLYGAPLLEGNEKTINYKLAEAVELEAEGLDIRWEGLRKTKGGHVATDLIMSMGGVAVKYSVYLGKRAIVLQFVSTDRDRVELAARLLRLAGVAAEVRKEGSGNVWYVRVTTDKLAAGREELRKTLAGIVKETIARGWVDAGKAERWLEKLEGGLMLVEGWPKYNVKLSSSGALEVRFSSTSPDRIQREAQRLEKMGLKWGVHFSVKMPEGGKKGYVSILREGLERAAWLSVYGTEEQRDLAARFVSYILRRAEEAGKEVYEKVREIVEEGRSWASQTLRGFEKEVEVNGVKYKVKVIDGEAVEEKQNGKTLLRIRITAEVGRVEGEHMIVDRVVREYTITFIRRGADNAAVGFAYASADAPDGREADAERLAALIKALTGKEPRIRRLKNGKIMIECYGGHLEGFMGFAELADVIKRWLEETSRR
jgi:DUF971 family protein